MFTDDDERFRLRFGAPGRVTLTLCPPPTAEAPPDRRRQERRSPHAWIEGVLTDARDVVFRLAPAQAPTAALERTTHRAELQPGGWLGLTLVDANGDPLAAEVQVTVETAAGLPVSVLTLEPDEGGHVSRWLFAPFGELRIRAETADGRCVEETHRLTESTPSGALLIVKPR